jgi:hypothetical protein
MLNLIKALLFKFRAAGLFDSRKISIYAIFVFLEITGNEITPL